MYVILKYIISYHNDRRISLFSIKVRADSKFIFNNEESMLELDLNHKKLLVTTL